MMEYKDKKILVVGLARSGIAAAAYLLNKGFHVTVTDIKKESELEREIKTLKSSVKDLRIHALTHLRTCFGSNPSELFTKCDLVVLSPGVPLELGGVKLARKNGIPVVCEMELGLPELSGRVIAITGTNGKSTVTALIGELLNDAGKRVWVGGNIGRPLIGDIETAKGAEYVVLEISSYQLETTPSLKPFIAVWLNVTPDHLDRYASMDDYIRAKSLIGQNQTGGDFVVFNRDDRIVVREIEKFRSKKIPFSMLQTLNSSLKGVHNMENVAAASVVAGLCGLDKGEIERGVARFKGLPHRLQFVKSVDGVEYYDDSKGTNTGAVVRSIQSFDVPIILIAGGQGKNTGYGDLKAAIPGRVRCILAIGEAAERIREELGETVEVDICATLEDAVNAAAGRAKPGDVVLLSPACASFDMFRDYAERGDKFIEYVGRLNG